MNSKEKKVIFTQNAPEAIGTYSQAIKISNFVFLSGQIPLDPNSMELVGDTTENGINLQIHQVFKNLSSVAEAAGGSLDDIVKLNLYLTNLSFFSKVNEIMKEYFTPPFPARAAVGVNSLPKNCSFEAEGIMIILKN